MSGLFLLFVLIGFPMMELYFLIEVGSAIGGFYTIAITIFTAVAGIHLIKIQGIQTLAKIQSMIQKGETPAIAMLEGVLLSIAAIFLVIPGFVSDSFGALLLLTPLRQLFASSLLKSSFMKKRAFNQSFTQNYQSSHSDTIVDAEYEDVTEKDHLSIKKDN